MLSPFAQDDYVITLHHKKDAVAFSDNSPTMFANYTSGGFPISSYEHYEVGLLNLYFDGLRSPSQGMMMVECSLAVNRQVVDKFLPVIHMLAFEPTQRAQNSAEPIDEDLVSVTLAENRGYVCANPQYHPLNPFVVGSTIVDIRIVLGLIGKRLQLDAEDVFATVHIRRRSNAPPCDEYRKVPQQMMLLGEEDNSASHGPVKIKRGRNAKAPALAQTREVVIPEKQPLFAFGR